MSHHVVITIARQYGSAGRAIGQHIAKKLGIDLYDKELITMSANIKEMSPDVLMSADEKAPNSLLYTLALGSSIYASNSTLSNLLPINDQLFITQSDIIKNLAKTAPCVIVGRCADYVLREHPGRISVFLYANTEFRKQQVIQQNNVSSTEALDMMNKVDRRRISYYNFYTGRKWGLRENYNLSIDSSVLGIEGTADVIVEYAKIFAKKNDCILPGI
ncbi:MAG: cytidylate kinase-like family protein [Clostridiales bacterium]|nr:cytidylate kinase-like family protein [Clostridiales bacterium]